MARAQQGLFIGSIALLVVGIIIYVAAVAGLLFSKATPFNDLGLYAVTIVLVGFGVGGLLLRRARMQEAARAQF